MDFYWFLPAREIRDRLVHDRDGRNIWLSILRGDIFFAPDTWPRLMRRKVWCSNLGYNDRLYIASYFWKNGMDVWNFNSLIRFCNSAWTVEKAMKMFVLYKGWTENTPHADNQRSRYYTFCHYHNEVHSLNCTLRLAPDGNVRQRGTPRQREELFERARSQRRGYHC